MRDDLDVEPILSNVGWRPRFSVRLVSYLIVGSSALRPFTDIWGDGVGVRVHHALDALDLHVLPHRKGSRPTKPPTNCLCQTM